MTKLSWTSPQYRRHGQDTVAAQVKRTTGLAAIGPPNSWKSRKCLAPIPAAIIDEDELFRAGLSYLLGSGHFRLFFGGSDLEDLPVQSARESLAIVLVGLGKDPEAMLSRLPPLKEAYKGLHTVVLSNKFQPDEMFAAIRAGARGYFVKNSTSPEALLKSLELVCLGLVVLPGNFGEALGASFRNDGAAQPAMDSSQMITVSVTTPPREASQPASPSKLSNREQMILQELTRGATNKHIARNLDIAEATVKVHLKSLLRKIHVSNRTQAAIWARDHSP